MNLSGKLKTSKCPHVIETPSLCGLKVCFGPHNATRPRTHMSVKTKKGDKHRCSMSDDVAELLATHTKEAFVLTSCR